MTRLLAHRGPDAEGFWCSTEGRLIFGHRRLSVIDIASGAQPMTDATGRFTLVFNGEIYNYRELREQLLETGACLKTESDSEVLLELLARHWTAALPKLTGMYAFAVWDADREELLLARDRIGEKPLYYCMLDGILYFASTFAAICAVHPGGITPDVNAVDTFLSLGYVAAPYSIAAGISKLPAGSLIRANEHRVQVERYWQITNGPQEFHGTYSDAVDSLDDLLSNAVRIRLRSDVPLGVFLSGGVDSSLVAALAAQHTSGIMTFSIGFDEAGYDESPIASAVATHLRSERHVFRSSFDSVDLVPQIVRHFGEPFGDPSALPLWMLAQETKRHVTVAVGGDGGDEGFGGYSWYRTAARLRHLRARLPRPAVLLGLHATKAASWLRPVGRLQRALTLIAAGDSGGFARQRSFVSELDVHRLYQGALLNAHRSDEDTAVDRLAALYDTAQGTHLRRMRIVDIETYLADCLMPKIDVATMAHGLEARAPLLDHDVLQFALSLPDDWLVTPSGGKSILKDVLYRHLPRQLFARPKQGFSVPLDQWFRGQLRDPILRLGRSEALGDLGWVRLAGVQALAAEHMSGYRDNSQQLYNLLLLEEWLTQYT